MACGEVLKSLLDRRLVTVAGRAEELAGKKPMSREVHRFQGYIEPKDFLTQFRFVGERAYEKGSLTDFLKSGTAQPTLR